MQTPDPRATRPRRSFLFVPGTGLEMLPKALAAGPDIICVDLEDAIAPQHKDAARRDTLAAFGSLPENPAGCELVVRINSLRTPDGLADVLAVLASASPPPSLMLPKIKSADEVRLLDELLGQAAAPVRLQLIIETNEGLEHCQEIAQASPRVDALLFGGADMAAELRVEPRWEALLYARSRLVHAAASAQIDLIDVPYLDLEDMAGLEREAALCAELGMTGKGAIHPKQLPIIERHFSPSDAQIAHAERVTAAFEQADSGLLVVDGKLIEKPVLRSQYRILTIAERLRQQAQRS
ncbi:MAG: HpcH/HpaI aldolase/citrate lyase family protein [Gammaproteobacteria bacterium]|jgi:citrate lyase beta subunit